MTKSTAESSKSAKRKGTRSVSTLTPSQLARKRANDREAQRAIRARTKEHIENLERELEELRRTQNRDDTLQDLMKRNQQLEAELHRLRESMGLPTSAPSSSYPHSSYNSPGSTASSYVAGDVASYDGLPPSSDPWTPAVSCSIPSTVSSPSSSGADDFGPGYYPTSAPSMIDRSGYASSMGSPTISCIGGKMGYEELEPDMACPPLNMNSLPSGYPPHQVAWNVYPAMYYQASPTL